MSSRSKIGLVKLRSNTPNQHKTQWAENQTGKVEVPDWHDTGVEQVQFSFHLIGPIQGLTGAMRNLSLFWNHLIKKTTKVQWLAFSLSAYIVLGQEQLSSPQSPKHNKLFLLVALLEIDLLLCLYANLKCKCKANSL